MAMNKENNNDFDFDLFLRLRRHLKIVHHVPGRVRLRVGASIVKEVKGVDASVLDKILGAISGIKDIRVNAMAGSVVIQYVADELKPSWWDTLVNGEDDQSVELMNSLLQDKLAPAVSALQES
jgi:hypothetical protein